MTLLEVIHAIEDAAAMQPSVAMIIREDVLRLNSYADARYGVFAWTQGRHRADINDDYMRYAFTFFYIDRLRSDIRNQVEIQSVGIETLRNVLLILRDAGIEPETYEFTTFNQRFADECAGVFCSVVLVVENGGPCAVTSDSVDATPDGWQELAADVIIRDY